MIDGLLMFAFGAGMFAAVAYIAARDRKKNSPFKPPEDYHG